MNEPSRGRTSMSNSALVKRSMFTGSLRGVAGPGAGGVGGSASRARWRAVGAARREGWSAVVVDDQPRGCRMVRAADADGRLVQGDAPVGQPRRGEELRRQGDHVVFVDSHAAGREEQPVAVADDDVADAVWVVGLVLERAVDLVDVDLGGDLDAVDDGDGVVEAHQLVTSVMTWRSHLAPNTSSLNRFGVTM